MGLAFCPISAAALLNVGDPIFARKPGHRAFLGEDEYLFAFARPARRRI
jgi:hypothetical protein